MLPALQVTVPLFVNAPPAPNSFKPPLMLKVPLLAIVTGPTKLPALQVAAEFSVVPPVSESVPPLKSKVPSKRAEPAPLRAPVPTKARDPPPAINAPPVTVNEPAPEMFKLSAFKKPSTVWAEVRLTTAACAPRSIKMRWPTVGTPKLQFNAFSQAPVVLLSQKLTVAAGPKNNMRLLPTCAGLLDKV